MLLPASVLVFVMGFSAGLAQIRVFDEKFADLEAFLNDLREGGGSIAEGLDIERIKSFVGVVEGAKRAGDLLGLDFGGGKRSGSKPGRKRKDLGFVTADLVQFITGLVMPAKAKDIGKGDLAEKPVLAVEEPERLAYKNVGRLEGSGANGRAIKSLLLDKDNSFRSTRKAVNANLLSKEMLLYDEEPRDENRSSRFTTKHGTVQKTVLKHNYEQHMFQSDMHRSSNRDSRRTVNNIDFFTAQSEASSLLEETVEISNKSYNPSSRTNVKEEMLNPAQRFVDGNHQSVDFTEEGKMPPSATTSVDEEFCACMAEATELLKKATECMASKVDEETADRTLYKSARLLSAAIDMRPMSLLAVGQLGNTYLLHGELKLNISRELRVLLLRGEVLPNGRGRAVHSKRSDILRREDISPVLVEVCEECEGLLIEAGRKYKMALSIDGNDVRALYNWGLALSFRAQLIADIGPEAAVDADKVYLAAIDKFDAMMSRSNLYATNALYRWGLALQHRSYLRPHNNKERIKLLHQAKSLFEDVLSMESDNKQVREALDSCVYELIYNRQL